MLSLKRITRRDFLTNAFFAGGLLVLNKRTLFKDSPNDRFEKKVVQLLKHKKSAKAIGLEYLKQIPMNKEKLLTNIFSTLKRQSSTFHPEIASHKLLELLRTCRQEDFEKGRVVQLQGWLLSITEAQLCALVAKQPAVLEGGQISKMFIK